MLRKRLASVFLALGVAGVLFQLAPAAQAQQAQICVKAKVVVNGEPLVDEDECVLLPPAE